VELGETAVRDLAIDKRTRNDADDFALQREHGIGEHSH
jgi:hypothetical protein